MESINIKTDSQRTLCINGDDSRWIAFDAEDLNFYGRLKVLYSSLISKHGEFEAKEEKARAIEGEDENGAPLSALALIDIQTEFANHVISGMDAVFGEGTCYRLFANTFNPDAYGEVIKAVLTHISRYREKKLKDELKKAPGKKVMS